MRSQDRRCACRVAIAALAVTVSAGAAAQTADFATKVPGAVIEIRDGPTPAEIAAPTKVVVLGTGTPIPDARRAGPSIAVIYKGETLLFDVGAGSIQNAVTARYQHDIPSLYPSQICCVFLSHMHSDHTMDYAELAFTLWWRRREPLRTWGPQGLLEMNKGMYDMMAPDTALRVAGVQPLPNPHGYRVQSEVISPGVVFENDGLVVEAFDATHGGIKPAFSFKVTTPDKSIVISGDTAFNDELLRKSKGVDLLFHEVISDSGLARNTEFWQKYHRSAHTTASDLGQLASEARPGLLVLYHVLYYGVPESTVLDEVRAVYDGEVVLANDLDVF
jgi:ribonuclease BN (tRNA processing enzyme)